MGKIIIKSQRVVDAEKRLKELDHEFGCEDLSLSIEHKFRIALTHITDVMNKTKLFTTGVVVNDRELHYRYCCQLCLIFFDKYPVVD